MTNKQEQGRSMVEMLGVLAVVGVLSAGGIAGYTYAMDRHRTNELLNEASKRAVVVASQIASGRTPSLAEFGTGETAGGTFSTDAVTDIDGAVGIKVTGVKDSVCENLIKLENDRVYMAKDDASLTALTEADCTGDNAEFLIVFEGMGGGSGVIDGCLDSEKVKKYYKVGTCCDSYTSGQFCPDEDPPVCVASESEIDACIESCNMIWFWDDDDNVCCDPNSGPLRSKYCCEGVGYGYAWDEDEGVCCESATDSKGCCLAFGSKWDEDEDFCCESATDSKGCCLAFGSKWDEDEGVCCSSVDSSKTCCENAGYPWDPENDTCCTSDQYGSETGDPIYVPGKGCRVKYCYSPNSCAHVDWAMCYRCDEYYQCVPDESSIGSACGPNLDGICNANGNCDGASD